MEGNALLQALVSLVARQTFPPKRLAEIVGSGEKQKSAFNMCDGTKAQGEIAKATGIDKASFSRIVSRWIAEGVLLRLGDGKLVPAKMGKNGDQIPRMFRQDADIYFVQHHGQIEPSVLEQMQAHAIAKSHYTRQQVYYGVIDGYDSERLRLAYPDAFKPQPKKTKPKGRTRAKRR